MNLVHNLFKLKGYFSLHMQYKYKHCLSNFYTDITVETLSNYFIEISRSKWLRYRDVKESSLPTSSF